MQTPFLLSLLSGFPVVHRTTAMTQTPPLSPPARKTTLTVNKNGYHSTLGEKGVMDTTPRKQLA
jgi:hypothetical protein